MAYTYAYIYIYRHTHIYIYIYIGCLNIHGTHVTANKSTNDNEFFVVSNFKIVYYNSY